jgi:penicillin-binding protein 1A
MDKPKKSMKRRTKRLLFLLLAGFVLCSILLLGLAASLIRQAGPLDTSGLDHYELTSVIYDENGRPIQELHGPEQRIPIRLEQVSPQVVRAVVSIEDRRFYEHRGVDLYRIAGAFWTNYKQGKIVQGASTITQQMVGLAKLDRREKTWERKIKEGLLALKVEQEYSKDEILELYLNWVYFGSGAYGIEAAAQDYFGKSALELNTQEGALLAGLIQSPSQYSPRYHPEAALRRRAMVLDAMAETGSLGAEEAASLKDAPLDLIPETPEEAYRYSSYTDYVIEQALAVLGLKGEESTELFSGGYRIYTALDAGIQEKMEEVYRKSENFPEGESQEIIQSAMVVLDPHTGEIKGMVGGRELQGKRGFNRAAQAMRQPGSAFKPLVVFGPALEMGYGPATVVDDFPKAYQVNGEAWCPQNYDSRYRGLVSMRTAAKYSINIWSVKMLSQIGIEKGMDFAEKLGISTLVREGAQNDLGLSLALGGLTKGVTPLELTAAYGTFANQGVYIKPSAIRKIEGRDGRVVWENPRESRRVMSEQSAYLMTSMLQTGVEEGTGKMAQMADWPVAGKTGTTSDTKDAWFVGYTPRLVGTVWLGYDAPKEMKHVIGGGRNAGPIWKQVMEAAHASWATEAFTRPADIAEVAVDAKSGMRPSSLTPKNFIVKELFNAKDVPVKVSDIWSQIMICTESHQLATGNCPSTSLVTLFQRPEPLNRSSLPETFRNALPEDQSWAIPMIACTLHGTSALSDETKPEAAQKGKKDHDDENKKER